VNILAGKIQFLQFFPDLAFQQLKTYGTMSSRKIWKELKELNLARQDVNWLALPQPVQLEAEKDHPFNRDLEVTGETSLHRLLNSGISHDGAAKLGKWLLAREVNPDEVTQRQNIIRELRGLSGFCSNLYWQFKRIAEKSFDGKALLRKLQREGESPPSMPQLVVMKLLIGSTLTLLVMNLFGYVNNYWILPLIVYILLYFGMGKQLSQLFNDTIILSDELDQIDGILQYLKRYPYHNAPELATFCSAFRAEDGVGDLIKRIQRIIYAVSFRMNPMLMILLNLTFPYDYFWARRLYRAREELAAELPSWIARWAELEAMADLATMGWLNPSYTFPRFAENGEGPVYAADNLGHPLLPEEGKIRNSIEFLSTGETLLITGSNMSGKSTFLKTMGANLVLANAGGLTDSTELRLQPMRLFTSINVSDSLSDGFSYFYAEVRRLKQLLEALEREGESKPLFFLIDEIFKGTNNRERLIGSQSYIAGLSGKFGVGGISTHDLELTRLAESFSQLRNMHFREEVVDGKMTFDYKIHEGPCPTTNALTIMQLAGLPVKI
ncbi:MAG: hypothetical protein AAFP70_13340, partial [Calditrichota bacterium]